MHRRVAAGAPTAAQPEKGRVILASDENAAGAGRVARQLRVAFQAQVVVALDQQLRVDRAVGVVADGAAFTHGFMFKDERPGLFAMTLGAGLVKPRHGEAAGGLHDVVTVRVVALHAVHFAFDDGMMLRQVEFRVRLEMTLKAGRRVLAGIEDEFAAATANGDVLAAGTVAGFATILALPGLAVEAQTRMRAGDKTARVVGVTFEAGAIAGEVGAFDGWWRNDRALDGGTRNERQPAGKQAEHNPPEKPHPLHRVSPVVDPGSSHARLVFRQRIPPTGFVQK